MSSLRMMEIVVPADRAEELCDLLADDEELFDFWTEELDDGLVRARVLLPMSRTEGLSDLLSDRFSSADRFRVLFFSVEATVPRIEEPEEPEAEKGDADQTRRRRRSRSRSRRGSVARSSTPTSRRAPVSRRSTW